MTHPYTMPHGQPLGRKTASFAAVHFVVAFSVTFALTGDVVAGGLVALIEPAVNTVAYALHERWWSRRPHGSSPVATPASA